MMDITRKSPATLLDEYFTACIKYSFRPTEENKFRRDVLNTVVESYIDYAGHELSQVLMELQNTLKKCWDAQEVIMENAPILDQEWDIDIFWLVARAAVEAQRTNAQRNKLIRKIDELLGESSITQLEKTYG